MTKAQIKKAYEAYGSDVAAMEAAGLTAEEINEVINYAADNEPVAQKPQGKPAPKLWQKHRVDIENGEVVKGRLLLDNVNITAEQAETLNNRLHNVRYYPKN